MSGVCLFNHLIEETIPGQTEHEEPRFTLQENPSSETFCQAAGLPNDQFDSQNWKERVKIQKQMKEKQAA